MMVGMWHWLRKLQASPLALSAWMFAYFAYLCVNRIDLDYGWHFRSGQYILAHGIPRHDVFSYTASGFEWINHEWLNDVIMYAVGQHLGYTMLGLLYAALWTAALLLVTRRRLGWVTVGLALGALLLYAGIRAETWTALGFALTIRLLEAKRPRYWLLVPMLAVWANLHAGFAIGLAVVGLKAVMDRSWRLAGWGVAAAAATLLNVYGVRLYEELWRTMSDAKLGGRIVEWGPLAINYSVAPYVLAVIVVLIAWWKWDFRRVRSAGLMAAALWANRQLAMLVVGSIEVVDQAVQRGLDLVMAGWPRRRERLARLGLALGVGVAFPLALLHWPPRVNGGIRVPVPVQALADLKAHPCQGHIFNDYNYGGLMIWVFPKVPDYIDGRMPSWRGPDGSYLDRYVQVLKGGSATDAEFAKFNIRCAMITQYDDKLSDHLRRRGWRLAVKANGGLLWRRD